LCVAIVLVCLAGVKAAEKRGVTAEDYLAFQFLADPQISPDGKSVAYVATTINQKKNRRESAVWVVATDGSGASRRLTVDGYSSNAPRWSPDGATLAFLSSRNAEPAAGEPHG